MEQKPDIVERLRDDYQKTVELCAEAADTIELLRGKLKESNAACKAFLRELGKDQG